MDNPIFHGQSRRLAPPKAIPGFYYDEERKKYFKIEPNHATNPAAAAYTRQAVRDKQQSSKRRRLNTKESYRRYRQTIDRSHLWDPRLGGYVLSNRLGSLKRTIKPGRGSGLDAFYGSSLSNRTVSCVALGAEHQQTRSLWLPVGDFVHDPSTGALICAVPSSDHLIHVHSVEHNRLEKTIYCNYMAPEGAVASLSMSDSRVLMLSINSPDSHPSNLASVQMLPLLDPIYSSETYGTMTQVDDYSEKFSISDTKIWMTAEAPKETKFAFASSSNLHTTQPAESRWEVKSLLDRETEFITCEWQNRNTIIGGRRNGLIKLVDTRTNDSVFRLRHQSGVSGTKMVDDYRLVVRGLEKMHMYDLRYAKPPSMKRHREYTRPYLGFPEFQGSNRFCLGLDYYPDLKILATASDKLSPHTRTHPNPSPRPRSITTTNNTIRLFSCTTGHTLSNNNNTTSALQTQTFDSEVTRIRFAPSLNLQHDSYSVTSTTTHDPDDLEDEQEGGAGYRRGGTRSSPLDLMHNGAAQDVEAWSVVGWAENENEDEGED